jgi:hypothetical protein
MLGEANPSTTIAAILGSPRWLLLPTREEVYEREGSEMLSPSPFPKEKRGRSPYRFVT